MFSGKIVSYPYSGNAKYYIGACFRLEGYYLEDWIKYHLALGFDGIFLCDNNSGDEDLEYVKHIKAQFPKVQIINKRNKKYKQEKWYGEIYNKIGAGDWCLFLDIDEYLAFGENMSLYHYMSLVSRTPCQQIKLNWMIHGNNKEVLMRPGSVRERFPKPALSINGTVTGVPDNGYIKTYLVGGMHLRFPSMHYAIAGGLYGCTSDFVKITNHALWVKPTASVYKYVYIRHYKTRSEQEFCRKILKWKGNPKSADNRYKWVGYDKDNAYEPNQRRTGLIGEDCNTH